jgi:hypothetical protein
MPNTPLLALPYPAATDPVAGGALAIQALAEGVELASKLLASHKLTAVGNVLTIPAGTFTGKFAAIELVAVLYQAGVVNGDRTPWALRVLPANAGDYAIVRTGNAGTAAVAMGAAREAGSVGISNIQTHAVLSLGPAAVFRARLDAPSEARPHLLTWEWFCRTDTAGTPGQDYGAGSGRALITANNVAHPALTGLELFAVSGPGFGVGSFLTARGIGAHSAGLG